MSICGSDIIRHFQHWPTYGYESIYAPGFILSLLSWFSNSRLLLGRSMCHKEPQWRNDLMKDSFWGKNHKRRGGRWIPTKQNKKNTWGPLLHRIFQILAKKDQVSLEKRTNLKADIKAFEGMSKFVCFSGSFPKDNFLGREKHGDICQSCKNLT